MVAHAIEASDPDVLDMILDISRSMLDFANDGEWETVARLEGRRGPLLLALFAEPIAPERVPEVAACVREVLNIDKQIITSGEAHRQTLMESLQDISRGRRAHLAYSDHLR